MTELETKILELAGALNAEDVHQTHISVVFVTGNHAYKMKKPVDLGFVDYSTLRKRKHFCEEEVRLNQRLAGRVYRGVRAIIRSEDSYSLADAADPDAVDYVVEMQRLFDADTFLEKLHRAELDDQLLADLGRKMAAFHQTCARGVVDRYGSFETVAKNARDNFSQSESQIGQTVSPRVFELARDATEEMLQTHHATIAQRDAQNLTCDSHGDLRLEHVYTSNGELFVVDCIEFNDAFRFSDPVSDIAFFVMDLRIRWGDASAFTTAYFEENPGGEELLDFYVAYRSAVRAKVHGIAAIEPELDDATRERARVKSHAHWLFTWSTLAPCVQRPALVIVAGVPGIGKTSLTKTLERTAGFESIDSDVVRKSLAGVAPTTDMRAGKDEGIYTAEWTERTYNELLRLGLEKVAEGGRVAISATFRSDARREKFLRAAHANGVCGVMIECVLDREEAHRRIRARKGDASDANVEIHDHIAETWEPPSPFVESRRRVVSTESYDVSDAGVAEILAEFELI